MAGKIQYKIVQDGGITSLSNAILEPEGQTAILVYRVPKENLRSAPREFLGVHYSDGNSLFRELPQFHPIFTNLWAERIEILGEGAASKVAGGFFANEVPFAINDNIDAYDNYLFQVLYTIRPYIMLRDGKVTKEYQRFIEPLSNPRTEFLTIEGGSLEFVHNTSIKIPNGYPFRFSKTDHKWIWHYVPETYLYGNGRFPGSTPTKIAGLVGKINNAEWNGFPAESLYLDSVRTVPVFMPLRPKEDLGHPDPSYPPRLWTVEFNFIEFEEGWNKAPLFSQTVGSPLWRAVQLTGTGGRKPYDTGNFDDLFAPNN